MVNNIPKEIRSFCEAHLGVLRTFTPASGGCINNGGIIVGEKGERFIKWNSAKKFPDMFTTEAKGLQLLSKPACIKVPGVTAVHEGEQHSGILMEVITPGKRSSDYWQELARSLARLHRVTQEQFGLDHQNYIGSLPQYNYCNSSWIDFFIHNRLEPQTKMAFDAGKISLSDVEKFKSLQHLLPQILVESKPSLIHGDLWSGNLMTDSAGKPAIIDPAVSFSHREMELAYTQLFGGFDQTFYQSYHEEYPLEAGYQERADVYNIYPLMVHVNLFDGGYYNQVMNIVSKFVR